ncbi:MAG: hypothetical protein AAB437_01860 [Patescibacteria group bacterium]
MLKIVHPSHFERYFAKVRKTLRSGSLTTEEGRYLITNARCAIEEGFFVKPEIMIQAINRQREAVEIAEDKEIPFDKYISNKELLSATAPGKRPKEVICGYAELMAEREERRSPDFAIGYGIPDLSPKSILQLRSNVLTPPGNIAIVEKVATYPNKWRAYSEKIAQS